MDFTLAFYLVANVLDCFSNFPAGLAEPFFYFALGVFCATFTSELIIVESATNSLFGFAFDLIKFSFNFVSVR
jgi:hypothetical protein